MVKTIDNFLSKDLYLQMKETFLGENIPWFLKKGTVDNEAKDIAWFSHCIYNEFKPDEKIAYEKSQGDPGNIQIWTEEGWTNIICLLYFQNLLKNLI